VASIKCIVVTPETTALETDADFVALPLADGELGIGNNHAPMIGRLGFGELRVVKEGKTETLYVDGGFVQIANNVVNVLTGKAVQPAEIDLPQAEQQLAESITKSAPTDEAIALKTRSIEQARSQIRSAKRAAN